MKHLLLILCLVSFNALQTSMAASVLKTERAGQVKSIDSPNLAASTAAFEEAATAFSVAPIAPDLSNYRSEVHPTLASANCITFFYNVGGIWMSQRYCW